MKKILSMILVIAVFFNLLFTVYAEPVKDEIKILVNGKAVQFTGAKPFSDEKGIVQAQADILAKALSALTPYQQGQISISISKGLVKISANLGETWMTVNDVKRELGTSSMFINEQFTLPVQTLSEALGAKVLYNAANKTFTITTPKFTDVRTNDWFYNAVMNVADASIMGGYGNGKFGPNDKITIEQFLTIAVRIKGLSAPTGWKTDYMQKAKELRLLKNGEFKDLKAPIKRGEMARILDRLLNEAAPANLNGFTVQIPDYSSIATALKSNVLKMYVQGIMGSKGIKFNSNDNSTRAQAATVVERVLDRTKRNIPTVANGKTTPDTEDVSKLEIIGDTYKLLNGNLQFIHGDGDDKQFMDVAAYSTLYTKLELIDIFNTVYSMVKGTDKYLVCDYVNKSDGSIRFTIYANKDQYEKSIVSRAYCEITILTNGNFKYAKIYGKELSVDMMYITDKETYVPKSNINDYLPIVKEVMKLQYGDKYSDAAFNKFAELATKVANEKAYEKSIYKTKMGPLYAEILAQANHRTQLFVYEK